jgi:hypothetical protein
MSNVLFHEGQRGFWVLQNQTGGLSYSGSHGRFAVVKPRRIIYLILALYSLKWNLQFDVKF